MTLDSEAAVLARLGVIDGATCGDAIVAAPAPNQFHVLRVIWRRQRIVPRRMRGEARVSILLHSREYRSVKGDFPRISLATWHGWGGPC